MYIQNCLGKYNEYAQLFEKELNRAKKIVYLNIQ